MLVYDYVPNKTLNYHLYHLQHEIRGGILDWLSRFKIIKGTVKAIQYLHEACDPRIIHRDIFF